jgi:hypothetical protein
VSGLTADADTLANGLPRAVADAIAPWTSMWLEAIPGFTADSLRPDGHFAALRGGYVLPHGEASLTDPEDEVAMEVLSARSPGGRYELVFDQYQEVTEDESGVDVGGGPDSAPLLIDFKSKSVNRFEFCGTPCGFQWGGWVDSTRFALAGWEEVDAAGDTLRGTLGVYSLADSSRESFITRAVPSDVYARYLTAWRKWVSARYREWKDARRPT